MNVSTTIPERARVGVRTTVKAISGLLVAVVAAAVLGSSAAEANAESWASLPAQTLRADDTRVRPIGMCTMAEPATRASVEVQVEYAADFCELLSHALASSVFRAPLIVTPGWLWHYSDATLSCGLRYRQTRYRMTIRNSAAACSWLTRVAVGWHREPAPPDWLP
jgi:hypothetical protein